MTRRAPLGLAITASAVLASFPAAAQICTVASTGLSYGVYDPFAPNASSITGTVTVTCQATVAIGLVYSIQLGAGTGGSVAARSMGAGASRLSYQLYTNAARNAVWGDGTGGTAVVSDGYLLVALATAAKTYTAYGTIPARQVVTPGAYSDVLSVLVVY